MRQRERGDRTDQTPPVADQVRPCPGDQVVAAGKGGVDVALVADDLARLAAGLLLAAALFQMSDGLQISALGALRGLKDVNVPMLVTFVSYWVVGLPLAYFLGIHLQIGPFGLWWGLIVGLTIAAVLLASRFQRLTARL